MKRRSFIQTSSIVTLPMFLRGMEVTAIAKSSLMNMIGPNNDKILVLVQLNGGNDGLNTFIPLDQYSNLSTVRSSIMLPENTVLKVNESAGFHPSMTGFKNMYDDGMLAVIQGVSYPNQNRSHFRSTDIWNTASESDQFLTTGWLGRYLNTHHADYPEAYPNEDYPDPFAITLGYVVSETCQGSSSNYSFAVSGTNLISLVETENGEPDSSCYGMELDFVRQTVKSTNAYTDAVSTAFDKGGNMLDYPEDNKLGDQLKIVANLISGGLQTKIYVVSMGGFDTHASQVLGDETTRGNHADLLFELSAAIETFQKDISLAGYGDKVVGMTFSEFGRRIKANDSLGTDHGTAAPLFVFGNCINTNVYGENAQISANIDDQEGVAMQYDFRSVYASLLMDWFGASKEDVQSILFQEFQYIPFLKNCLSPTALQDLEQPLLAVQIAPNPFTDQVVVSLDANGDTVHLGVFDVRGSLVLDAFSKKLIKGRHDIPLDLSPLPAGSYYLRAVEGNKLKTSKLIKI